MQGKRVRDADYSALAADTYVGLYDLTASRRVFLPLSSDFPLSQPFYVADESGVCSQAIAITVVASGADTIAGQTTVTMIVPYQKLVFHSNGAGLWTFA